MKNLVGCIIVVMYCAEALAEQPRPSASMQAADATAIQMAQHRIEGAVHEGEIDSPGRVVVVYFTPRERKPAANHIERIRRIVEETAAFYEQELRFHGFKDRSMNVLRTDRGEIDMIEVVGQDADYDKPDGQRIRNEVVPVLRERGIDPNASVLLLFCNLMDYDPIAGKISHHSPYYGGGGHLQGTAWQCDSEILDPRRFRDTTPILDGEYGRITIGRHNSIFIGGVIHELGHALSLPHCRQRQDEASRGTALMGSGNRTYAEQLRGEGRGTFLTQAHALRLAAHPVFSRKVPLTITDQPQAEYEALTVTTGAGNFLQIRGRIESSIPTHGIIAYLDPDGGGDYDATTATAVPDEDGWFALRSEELKPDSAFELRLVACHVNGTTTTKAMRFRVGSDGQPDLTAVRLELELASMVDALRSGQLAKAKQHLADLAKNDPQLETIGRRVLNRFTDATEPVSLDSADVSDQTLSVPLSRLRPASASVGWLRPTYDGVPARERVLSIGGDYFARGIYAHAPAEHVYELNGSWKRLQGQCGIQGTQFGRVDFEIRGDGKTLWRADRISAGEGRPYDIDVQGVKTLTLVVSDSGNGRGGDWGVWIEPQLSR